MARGCAAGASRTRTGDGPSTPRRARRHERRARIAVPRIIPGASVAASAFALRAEEPHRLRSEATERQTAAGPSYSTRRAWACRSEPRPRPWRASGARRMRHPSASLAANRDRRHESSMAASSSRNETRATRPGSGRPSILGVERTGLLRRNGPPQRPGEGQQVHQEQERQGHRGERIAQQSCQQGGHAKNAC